MKDWIMQRSTWLGFGAAAIAVLGILVERGVVSSMWISIASAVLSAFGLGINDRGVDKKTSAKKGIIVCLMFAVIATGNISCGAALTDMYDEQNLKATIYVGCAAATVAGCFESSEQCVDAITDAIDGKKITPEVVKVILDLSTCEAMHDAIASSGKSIQK